MRRAGGPDAVLRHFDRRNQLEICTKPLSQGHEKEPHGGDHETLRCGIILTQCCLHSQANTVDLNLKR